MAVSVNISVKGSPSDVIRRELEKQKQAKLSSVAPEIVEALRVATPKDTKEASLGWKAEVKEDHVEVTNEVPYIAILNSGHSKQAPSLFIEQTALQFGTADGTIVNYR
jgi:hypothetical protein